MKLFKSLVILAVIILTPLNPALSQEEGDSGENLEAVESQEGATAAEPAQAEGEEGAEAGEEPLAIYGTAFYASRYVWRGIPLNEDPVIQPAAGISKSGFALELWGNLDTTDWGETHGGYGDEQWNLTELDYVGSYSWEIDKFSLAAGFLTYTYPNTPFRSSTEIFGSLGVDVPASPLFSVYMDVDGDMDEPALYLNLQLSHSFSLWESGEMSLGLDLCGGVGGATGEFTRINIGHDDDLAWHWHDWNLGLAVPFSLGKGFYITPGFSYSSLIDSDLREVVEDHWDRDPDNSVFSLDLTWEGEL